MSAARQYGRIIDLAVVEIFSFILQYESMILHFIYIATILLFTTHGSDSNRGMVYL